MIMGFIIWSLISLLFLIISLYSMKSKTVVGFYSFGKPPQVKDIKAYNKAVNRLWLVSAIIFELIGIPILFIEQNSPVAILIVFGVLSWVFGLMLIYSLIEQKYRVK